MTQDNRQRLILAATLITLLVCFVILFRAKESEDSKIATTKQAVVSSQASVDRAKSEYVATKDNNIQKEKQAAKKAVIEADEELNTDAEIGIAWGELVKEAKEYNDKVRGGYQCTD